jgi:anti-sigma factor RsiW
MEGERVIAGLSCRDVLADLSEYLDDQLPSDRRAQIDLHLRGCANCERFGGEFAATIAALRRSLTNPDPLDEAVSRRLHERLRRERG